MYWVSCTGFASFVVLVTAFLQSGICFPADSFGAEARGDEGNYLSDEEKPLREEVSEPDSGYKQREVDLLPAEERGATSETKYGRLAELQNSDVLQKRFVFERPPGKRRDSTKDDDVPALMNHILSLRDSAEELYENFNAYIKKNSKRERDPDLENPALSKILSDFRNQRQVKPLPLRLYQKEMSDETKGLRDRIKSPKKVMNIHNIDKRSA